MSFSKCTKNSRLHIAYLSLFCMFFSLYVPSRLYSQSFILNEEENCRRSTGTYVLAGVAVIALGAGIVYAASNSGHKNSCCSSSYSRCSYSSYSSRSSSSHSHSGNSSYSSSFFSNSSSSYSGRVSNDLLNRDFPLNRSQKLKSVKGVKNTETLSGRFIANSAASLGSSGNLIAFVQLPDGSTQTFGSFNLSERTGIPLTYGPFHESGTYVFGVNIERGSTLPPSGNVGTLEIDVNTSKIATHDFVCTSQNGQTNAFTYVLE